jgi:nitrogen-specific signal transduction histidine kinase
MTAQEHAEIQVQLDRHKRGIREIAHDISNPLGVLQMASYYLQHGKPDREKQLHYFAVIASTVEKVEAGLNKLRALSDNPMMEIRPDAPPANPTKRPEK